MTQRQPTYAPPERPLGEFGQNQLASAAHPRVEEASTSITRAAEEAGVLIGDSLDPSAIMWLAPGVVITAIGTLPAAPTGALPAGIALLAGGILGVWSRINWHILLGTRSFLGYLNGEPRPPELEGLTGLALLQASIDYERGIVPGLDTDDDAESPASHTLPLQPNTSPAAPATSTAPHPPAPHAPAGATTPPPPQTVTDVLNTAAWPQRAFTTLEEMLAALPPILNLRDLGPVDPRRYAVPIGITPDGRVVWIDLQLDTVNMGIFGVTGVGKDMLISQMIYLLCKRNSPEEIQFIIIDGKGDYLIPQFRGMAHMHIDPVGGYGNIKGIFAGLDAIHAEAARREQLIYGSGYRGRDQYVEATGKPLPLLVVIVTDQMTNVEGVIEDELTEVQSKARSLGMRVIMSFQNVSGKSMGWRTQVGAKLIGYMDDGTQDGPSLGVRQTKDIIARPSQLPYPKEGDPATKGLFVFRQGRDIVLVKAPYTPEQTLLPAIARLPRRPGYTPAPEAVIDLPATAVTSPHAPAEDRAEKLTRADLLREAEERERVRAERSKGGTADDYAALMAMLGLDASLAGGAAEPAEIEDAAEEPRDTEFRELRRASLSLTREERRERVQRRRGLRGKGVRRHKKLAIPPGLPPMPPIRPEPGDTELDEKLYRMMLVPLGLNEIRKALRMDKNTLSRECNRMRQERGMGSWKETAEQRKRERAEMSEEQLIERMAHVPMGYNEIYRVTGGNSNRVSELAQAARARIGLPPLTEPIEAA